MNCIIVDDEATARRMLEQYCKTESIHVKAEFDSAIEAVKWLNSNSVDILFLDIHMPLFNGLDLIKTLKNPPSVVFTTSDPQFAVDAFEYPYIIDYLLKPVSRERFKKTLEKYELLDADKNKSEVDDNLFVNIDKRLIKISMNHINYIQSERDYISIITESDAIRVHTTLWKIKSKLPSNKFVQTHRSYIINIDKIIDIEMNSVLIGKEVIPVSRTYKANLLERLNLLD